MLWRSGACVFITLKVSQISSRIFAIINIPTKYDFPNNDKPWIFQTILVSQQNKMKIINIEYWNTQFIILTSGVVWLRSDLSPLPSVTSDIRLCDLWLLFPLLAGYFTLWQLKSLCAINMAKSLINLRLVTSSGCNRCKSTRRYNKWQVVDEPRCNKRSRLDVFLPVVFYLDIKLLSLRRWDNKRCCWFVSI